MAKRGRPRKTVKYVRVHPDIALLKVGFIFGGIAGLAIDWNNLCNTNVCVSVCQALPQLFASILVGGIAGVMITGLMLIACLLFGYNWFWDCDLYTTRYE